MEWIKEKSSTCEEFYQFSTMYCKMKMIVYEASKLNDDETDAYCFEIFDTDNQLLYRDKRWFWTLEETKREAIHLVNLLSIRSKNKL